MAVTVQVTTVDLDKYTIVEYVLADLKMIEWWKAVMAPVVLAAAYILGGIFGLMKKIPPGKAIKLFLVLTLCSSAVFFAHALVGIMGVFTAGTLLISQLYYTNKHNKTLN